MENNWGRIGLKLQGVRKPEDVRDTLTLVPGVQFHRSFNDHRARCVLAPGDRTVTFGELSKTRQQASAQSAARSNSRALVTS